MKQHSPTKWHKLDNTANIFPAVANKRMTNVFRITAVLAQPVEPGLLQQALEETLPYFAAFNVRLRHGLFWHYFETNLATPHVHEEEDPPCRYLDPVETNRFLFRLLYFDCRVHLETFHVLSDGTGAARFLRAVCYRYVQLRYPQRFTPEQLAIPYGVENAANTEDGYMKNYVPGKGRTFKEPTAFHIRAVRRETPGMLVTTALLPVAQMKELCHSAGASVGEYLTAAAAFSIYEEYTCGNGAKQPISIFVPVNLRRFFPSDTSTNFFSNISICLPLRGPNATFDDVLDAVHTQFSQKCTKEAFAEKLSFTARGENSIFARIAPLPLKAGILRIIFEHSSNGSTLAFSNLGPVEIDPLFRQDFAGFRLLMTPVSKEPCKITAISCGDTVAITLSTILDDNAFARNIIRRLAAQGANVVVESSATCDEDPGIRQAAARRGGAQSSQNASAAKREARAAKTAAKSAAKQQAKAARAKEAHK